MAKIIQWREDYNTGCSEIDLQHQHLAEIINQMYEAFSQGLAESKVIEVLEELEEYTKTHFTTEEELFEKYNYPLKEHHIEEHRRLEQQVHELKQDFITGRKSLLSLEVMTMLKEWLLDHVLNSDHKYIDYLCK